MAISFSRPDPSSPAAVAGAAFPTTRRGFDPNEVRDFLRMVAAELSRLQERERFLERELLTRPTEVGIIPGELDEDKLTEVLGEETARIIQTAREAAAKFRGRAEETAQRLVRDATDEATRIREEAELEGERIRQDATADAEAEILMAKQQGRDMVNEARAYRERVLADVSRRRELAREQIEDLFHGRDRLVQAFERARIATDDVLRDLSDVGEEPAAYVNLAMTTGPIPIMVAVDELDEPAEPVVRTQFYDQDHDDEQPRALHPSIDRPISIETVMPETQEVDESDDVGAEVAEVLEVVVDEVASEVAEETADSAPVVELKVTPSNVVPLFGKSEPKHESTATSPAPRVERSGASGADDIFAKLRRASATVVAEEATKAGDAAEKSSSKPATPVATVIDAAEVVESATVFETRDEILVPLTLTMGRKTKRVLADEQNQILDTLRGKAVVKTLDAIVGPKNEHAKRFCAALAPSIKSAAVAGARSLHASGSMPSDRDLSAAVAKQMKAIDEFIVTSIVEPLRERLRRSISQAGGSNAELSSLVRVVYREWKNQVVDESINDIAYTAYGRGALSVLTPNMNVCWKFDPAGPACADAEDNSLAGTIGGCDAFPTGHTHAPAHAGCRCAIVPIHN
ncbi:MAG: DivIVA domain-containing protein [Actinomycetota bacterium]